MSIVYLEMSELNTHWEKNTKTNSLVELGFIQPETCQNGASYPSHHEGQSNQACILIIVL